MKNQLNEDKGATRKTALRVERTTFDQEQQRKDEEFLALTPLDRLRIHEEMRKRIWGPLYDSISWEGQKVIKRQFK